MDCAVGILTTFEATGQRGDLARATVAKLGGSILGTVGTICFARFGDHQSAMDAAIALQSQIDWSTRVAVSIGSVEIDDGRVSGRGLERAREILEEVRNGQIAYSTICDGGITGILDRESSTIPSVETIDIVAAVLQWSVLIGWFVFWMGLLVWRLYYHEKYNKWPCWPEFLCG